MELVKGRGGRALEAQAEVVKGRGGRVLEAQTEQLGWNALLSGLGDEVREVLDWGGRIIEKCSREQWKGFEQKKKIWFSVAAVVE